MKLSDDLRPIHDLEIELGNAVVRIDAPAGTACPLAVVFRDPIHFEAAAARLALPDSVDRWINRDPHYPIEEGYYSKISRHTLAGPLPAR